MRSSPEAALAWELPEFRQSRPTLVVEAAEPAGPDPVEQAYLRGVAEGEANAAALAEEQLHLALSACRTASRGLEAAAASLHRAMPGNVHALALAIARHLVGEAYEAEPDRLEALVRRALELAPSQGQLTIRMHPDDLAAFERIDGPASTVGEMDVRWIGDASLGRGSVSVDGPAAIVDGRIDRALLDLFELLNRE